MFINKILIFLIILICNSLLDEKIKHQKQKSMKETMIINKFGEVFENDGTV